MTVTENSKIIISSTEAFIFMYRITAHLHEHYGETFLFFVGTNEIMTYKENCHVSGITYVQ